MDMLRGGWGPGMLGNGMGVATGGGSSYAAETEAIAAAFTTPPTTARKNLIDACVVSLKSAGVWTKLDALYAFAAADSQAAKINWKAPGTFNATEVNAPSFAADLGFTGASTKYLDTGFNCTTAPSPNMVQNSSCQFAWSLTSTGIDAGIAGTKTSNQMILHPRRVDGSTLARMHTISNDILGGTASAVGFWSNNRSGSTTTNIYRNGAVYISGANASSAPSNDTNAFLQDSGTTWAGQCAGGGFGGSLNSTEQTALYNALNAYIASVRIFSAFTTPPSAARQTLIQNCVGSLITAGVWDKLDALYMLAAADSQAAKINWKNPGTYNCTEVNAPAFAADMGFTGAVGKWVDTTLNPITSPSPKYTQNDAGMFAWALQDLLSGGIFSNGQSNLRVYPKFTDGSYYVALQGPLINAPMADGRGLIAASRTTASSVSTYKNGVLIITGANTSQAIGNVPLVFLAGASDAYSGQIAAGGFGSQLSAAEHLAIYNALRAYLTGVGVP